MKLSILVPVFNREKTLRRCVDSLLHQDLDEYEIVLVDDGSTDGSRHVIEDYKKKYPEKIIAVFQENRGVAAARNAGLAASRGEYITWVDSDDWLSENCLGMLWRKVKRSGWEILLFDAWEERSGREARPYSALEAALPQRKEGALSRKEFLLTRPCTWNKWMKKSLWDPQEGQEALRFPDGWIYEDLATIPLLSLRAEKIGYTPQRVYHYEQSVESIMRQEGYQKEMDCIFLVADRLKHELEKAFPAEVEYLWWLHVLLLGGMRYLHCDRADLASRTADAMQAAFPCWKENEYVKRMSWRVRTKADWIYREKFWRLKRLEGLADLARKI
ncbi:glycosyltransferase family 2 protein [Hominifimenecus sp. rT4P-3]|uniref:glycosyltransferase family 2 protein n=1 Tax=Hominifimenecus sp. rT4P-3 TaxID=3242979 RepID=UPI003DA3BFBE